MYRVFSEKFFSSCSKYTSSSSFVGWKSRVIVANTSAAAAAAAVFRHLEKGAVECRDLSSPDGEIR